MNQLLQDSLTIVHSRFLSPSFLSFSIHHSLEQLFYCHSNMDDKLLKVSGSLQSIKILQVTP